MCCDDRTNSPRVNLDPLRRVKVDPLGSWLFCTTGDLLPEQDIPFELLFATGDEVRQIPLAREQSWCGELETCWSTIQSVADIFVSGVEVTPEAVKTLLADTRSKSI